MLRIIHSQRFYDPDEREELEPEPEEVVNQEPELPVITPDNAYQYLEPEEDTQIIENEPPPGFDVADSFLDEIPEGFVDDESLLQKAIEEQQCVAFEYTNRKGNYSGWRLVEPAGIWTAGTGNTLVCTWDRHRQGIRSFIIANIHSGTLKILPGRFYAFEPKFVFAPQ